MSDLPVFEREADRQIAELKAEVARLKANRFCVREAYAKAYKAGFMEGLTTDRTEVEHVNRTSTSIKLFDHALSRRAVIEADRYVKGGH